MGNLSYFLFCLILFLPIGSCSDKLYFGYPEVVQFGKDGGTQVFYGEQSIGLDFTVNTADHEIYTDTTMERNLVVKDTIFYETGVNVVHADWLTFKAYQNEPKIEIIARPNTTKRNRKFIVICNDLTSYTPITVKQSK